MVQKKINGRVKNLTKIGQKEEVENRETMAEEIPIEEFENDTQDVLEEYRKMFPEDDTLEE